MCLWLGWSRSLRCWGWCFIVHVVERVRGSSSSGGCGSSNVVSVGDQFVSPIWQSRVICYPLYFSMWGGFDEYRIIVMNFPKSFPAQAVAL